MATLKMAIDALNKDSQAWSTVSTGLSDCSTAAYDQDVSSGAFPINVPVELHSLYTSLQSKVGRLLSEGATESEAVADELINVRNILEGADEAAQQSIDGLWDFE
ncbi:MAG: hypothetical protein ABWY52_07975 [Candidatus Limnocylindrales bacterium]|jgi:hypothetical protein